MAKNRKPKGWGGGITFLQLERGVKKGSCNGKKTGKSGKGKEGCEG